MASDRLLSILAPDWRRPLLWLALVWSGLAALHWQDWSAMAGQWWNISTYNHILLIPPVIAWLVWQRAPQLVKLTPAAWWPGLLLCAGAAFLWLLGTFSGLDLVRQAGAVGLAICAVIALLGPRIAVGLTFPLAYMLFLVPFGDELVAPMQMITAKLTIALVHISAIPAAIDGVFISTPAGLFEVAEACSGVKFLVAMVAFAVLCAHVCFISWRRRLLFLAVSVVVPVLANGVRAWGTIFAAQYVGVEKAAGFDHIIYGWFFFAAVIAMVLALFWRHFDRAPQDPFIDAQSLMGSARLARLTQLSLPLPNACLCVMLLSFFATWLAAQAATLQAPLPRQVFLPNVPGWQRVDYRPQEPWQPLASGAEHRLLGRYADARGRHVDLFLAVYAAQTEGKEAGGFGQGALPVGGTWNWQSPGPAFPQARSDRLLGEKGTMRLAITSYHTGTLLTGSNLRLKLANTLDKLLLHPRPTMMLILSTEGAGNDYASADAIHDFRRAIGPVDQWMDRVAATR